VPHVSVRRRLERSAKRRRSKTHVLNLMYIGPCIIVIVEELETYLMSLVIKFYFTSSRRHIFRTSIHPIPGACDFSIVSPHWSCVLVSMCVGVSVGLVGVVYNRKVASSW